MVQKKEAPTDLRDLWKRSHEQFEAKHPVLKTRWFVIEITPSWHDEGYWGSKYYPEERHRVSDNFETQEEAQTWMDAHEPDTGKRLAVSHENLRPYYEERWGV